MSSTGILTVRHRTRWALVLRGLFAFAAGLYIIVRPIESVAILALVLAVWLPRTRCLVLLVNANDRTVRESAADALARDWARRSAVVAAFELPDSLRLPHNIIDPSGGRALGDAVLGLLRDLAYGDQPPAVVRALVVR